MYKYNTSNGARSQSAAQFAHIIYNMCMEQRKAKLNETINCDQKQIETFQSNNNNNKKINRKYTFILFHLFHIAFHFTSNWFVFCIRAVCIGLALRR